MIREGDLLLHHPYESFDPVVQFVQQAADDPNVLAIKQTLYRTSGNSPVVAALLDAAENGKQVASLIELKARFDEENNIHWARNLERVGRARRLRFCRPQDARQVTLVVRDEPDGLRRYMHFGTGNYNDKTARIYTDLSLFTCRPDLGADATAAVQRADRIFEGRRATSELLRRAERSARADSIALIDRETEHARAGRPAASREAQRDQRRRASCARSTAPRRPACRSI